MKQRTQLNIKIGDLPPIEIADFMKVHRKEHIEHCMKKGMSREEAEAYHDGLVRTLDESRPPNN